MKRLTVCLLSLLFCAQVLALDIFALGTSNTNSKGVTRGKDFSSRLEERLRADGFDVHVINGGVDGDKPVWMQARLDNGITADTRLVLFEPGPNDRNKASNVEYSEKILANLQSRKMPTIYLSHGIIQTEAEGQVSALKYGAIYYGHFGRNVPKERVNYQFDMGGPGHMTAEGVNILVQNIAPLVEKTLQELNAR